MQKFLRTMMLLAAFALPFASQAQTSVALSEDFAVAPEGWTGSTAAFTGSNSISGSPAWTYEAAENQGFGAGHYTVTLSNPNKYYWTVTPAIDLSDYETAELSVRLGLVDFATGLVPESVDSGKTVKVLVRVGNYGTWQPLASWSNAEGDSSVAAIGANQLYTFTLGEAVAGQANVYFAFYAENTTLRMGSVALYMDDVTVSGSLKCLPVTNVSFVEATATTATVSWTDDRNANAQFYTVRALVGDVVAASMQVSHSSISNDYTATVEGLDPYTQYTFEVTTYNNATTHSTPVTVSGMTDPTCYPVSNLAVVAKMPSSVTVEWTDLNNANANYVVTILNNGTVVETQFVNAMGCTFENLNTLTPYTITVQPVCGAGDSAIATASVNVVTPLVPMVTLYQSGFENLAMDADWTLSSATVNAWYIGEGANNGGSRALYISNDEGATNAYTNSRTTRSWAYLTLSLQPGTYQYSFDFRCNGEGNYDDASVFILPETAQPTGSSSNSYTVPAGAIQLMYNQRSTTWTTKEGEFTITTAGTYYFAISWRNDGSAGSNPPAAFDNISIIRPMIFSPENVAVSGISATTAIVEWGPNDNGEGVTYNVALIQGEDTVDYQTNELSYELTGLTPATNYIVVVSTLLDTNVYAAEAVGFMSMELCNGPSNLVAGETTRSTVSFSWEQEDENVTTYEYILSDTAIANIDAVAADDERIVTTEELSAAFDGLNRDSEYRFYLRSSCGENSSAWYVATAHTRSLVDCGAGSLVGPTVADGTGSNSYIPIYGNYCDAVQTNQMIYPESMLADLVGSTISSMKFYVASGSQSGWTNVVWSVKMATCTGKSLSSALVSDVEMTEVYHSTVVATVDDGMTINFDQPFVYEGGDLLIQFAMDASSGYASMAFYGTTSVPAGSSRYSYLSSWGGTSSTAYAFLPKVTFGLCAIGEACPAVAEVSVSDITTESATLSWERPDADYLSSYELVISTEEIEDFEAVTPIAVNADAVSYAAADLEQATVYYVYLRAVCERDSANSEWVSTSFRTLELCRIAENIEVAVNGKHTAQATWVNTGADIEQPANYTLVLSLNGNMTAEELDAAEAVATGVDTTEYALTDLLSDSTYYLYIKNVCAADNLSSSWMMSNAFTMGPELPAVINIEGTSTQGSVSITWESDVENYADETEWKVAIAPAGETPANWVSVNERAYTFISLTSGTDYTVSVVATDGENESLPTTANFTTTDFSGCSLVAEGTSTSNVVPLENNWLDTRQRSQMIYTADELPADMLGGKISGITFYVNSSTSWQWNQNSLDIRMGTTTLDAFGNDYIDTTGATVVMSNTTVTIGGGMVNFTFDTPFQYNGGNLFIDMNVKIDDGSYTGINYYGITKTNASRRHRGTGSASNQNFLPKATFCYSIDASGCVSVNVTSIEANDITTNSATVSWKPGYKETKWEYVNSDVELDSAALEAAATETTEISVAFSDLNRDADYFFYVRPICVVTDSTIATRTAGAAIDSVIAATDTMWKEGTEEPHTLADIDSTLTTWTVTLCDTVYTYDYTYSDQYGEWSMASYATAFDCGVPAGLKAEADITSATLIASATEGEPTSMTFAYWTEGTDTNEVVAMPVTTVDSSIADIVVTDSVEEYPVTGIALTLEYEGMTFDYEMPLEEWEEQREEFLQYYNILDSEYVYDTENPVMVPSAWDTTWNYTYTTTYNAAIEGLTASTVYTFVAKADCGTEAGISRWSDEATFATLCNGYVTLPYMEGFEDNSLNADCWTVIINDSMPAEPSVTNGCIYPAAGDQTIGEYDRYVISPEFDAEDSVLWASYVYTKQGDYSWQSKYGFVSFGYSTTDNDTASFIWSEPSEYAGTWVNQFVPADAKYVAFHFTGDQVYGCFVGDANLRELETYHLTAVNANPEMGQLLIVKNGNDTLEVADAYTNIDIYELTNVAITAVPNEGYHIVNWTLANGDTLKTSTYYSTSVYTGTTVSYTVDSLRADTNLTVHFAIDPYTLHVRTNNTNYGYAKIVDETRDGLILDTNNVYGTPITVQAFDTVEDHYIFRGWSKSNSQNGYNANDIVSYDNPYTFGMDGTYYLTAIFVRDSFNVTVAYDETMGEVIGRGKHATNDLNVHMAASPYEGYEFVMWKDANGDSLTAELAFDTLNADTLNMAFTAQFRKLPFYVTVGTNNPAYGTAVATPDEGLYLDSITLTATAVEGAHHHFAYWTDGSVENPYVFPLTKDTVMRAYFTIDTHMVKVVADTANFGFVTINGVQADSLYFDYGTESIILEAMPNTGVAFTAWNDGETVNPRTIDVLTMDTVLTANFDSILYNVAVNYNAEQGVVYMNEAVAPATVEEALYGQTIELVADAVTGYVFANWEDAQGNLYYDDTLVYTVNENETQSITAYFVEGGKVVMNLIADAEAGSVSAFGSYNNNEVAYSAEQMSFDEFSTFTMVATANEHYHFINWTSADTVYSTEDSVEVELPEGGSAMYFTANFALDTHYVKGIAENGYFVINGETTDSANFAYGTEVTIKAMAADHYFFVQWTDDAEADTTRTFTLTENTELSAEFGIDTYYVRVAANNELFGSVSAEGYRSIFGDTMWFAYGSEVSLNATANEGYHFVNWNTEATEPQVTLTLFGNQENQLIANFDTNVYTVTLVAENGTIEGATSVKHFTAPEYVAVPAYGYHFDSWTNITSTNDTAVLSPVMDTTITANFAKNSYTVTVAANNDEFGTVSGTATVLYLDTVTLYANANEGYHVENWSNGMTGDSIQVVADSNMTVTVNFAINVYNVTASANIAERGTVTGAHQTEHGALDTLVAEANYGYVFAGWNNGVMTDTLVLTVVSDTAVVASFDKATFTMTAAVNDTTMGTATVNNATALYLDTVVFTAVANTGYHFVSWSNGDTTDNVSVVVTGDTTLTATFEQDSNVEPVIPTFTVMLTSANSVMGTVSEGATVDSASSFTATATANEGYHFVAWLKGNDTVSTDATYIFIVTEDVSLVAHFAQDEVEPTIFTVTAQSNNANWGTVTGGGNYEEGDECTLVAHAAAGYHFVRWMNGDQVVGTSDTLFTFTVQANITITAEFAENTGIDDVDMSDVTIYSTDSKIIVRGAENQSIYVFDVNGRAVASEKNATETCEFRMASTGVYLVKVGNAPAKRVLVVR